MIWNNAKSGSTSASPSFLCIHRKRRGKGNTQTDGKQTDAENRPAGQAEKSRARKKPRRKKRSRPLYFSLVLLYVIKFLSRLEIQKMIYSLLRQLPRLLAILPGKVFPFLLFDRKPGKTYTDALPIPPRIYRHMLPAF